MSLPNVKTSQKGFTLVELIIVMGILAVILALVIVALNPARRFQDANDTQRSSDVNAIANAINQRAADTQGSIPGGIDNTVRTILLDAQAGNEAGEVDLCADLVTAGYLGKMPVDPTGTAPLNDLCTNTYNTGYTVVQNANGSITVSAPSAQGSTISVTR